MYRYGEYCPLAKTTGIIGDYWTPLIVRELLHGREHFNDLVRSLPEISRSLLSARLRAMERADIIECTRGDQRNLSSYRLTQSGRELRQVLDAMSDWGERWNVAEPHEADIHPMTTVCMLRARVRGECLPERRIVVQVVTKPPKDSLSWLVLENGVASLCDTHPGYDVDLFVMTDVPTLYRIWLDQTTLESAMRGGKIEVEGDRALALTFPGWFGPVNQATVAHFDEAIAG